MQYRSCDYDPELYRKVKEAVSMQQAAEYCGLVVERGHCLCPFHQDRRPSMKIYPDGKGYYCFSCGSGGDQVKLVARYQGIGNYEAAKELAEAFGVPVRVSLTYREQREAEKQRRKRRELAAFVKWAKMWLTVYRGLLCNAVREQNEHFYEGLGSLTYVEYLLDCLEQCPKKLYTDKKAVEKIGKVEGRVINWYIRVEADGSVSR